MEENLEICFKERKFQLLLRCCGAWFSTEMGELGVPDRVIDIFQGGAPRSVLAKHYTGKNLQRLKRIYEKANLRLLVE